MWQKVKSVIAAHRHFVILTHEHPDGDGLGSARALGELLAYLNKRARLVTAKPVPSRYQFLLDGMDHEVGLGEERREPAEVTFLLDAHTRCRLGPLADLHCGSEQVTVAMDHHERRGVFADYNIIDPSACCVGVLVFRLFQIMGVPLNRQAAEGIYTSLLCDTGRFSHSLEDGRAFQVADACIQAGADPQVLFKRLFQQISLSQMRLFARAMANTQSYCDQRVLIQEIRQEDLRELQMAAEVDDLDVDYMHDYNKAIQGVDCIILLLELPHGRVRVSVRGKQELNLGQLMGQLGGGGHPKAAGVIWQGSVAEIKERLLQLLAPSMVG